MDTYIKLRLGKNKFAVARRVTGGWFNITSTHESETMADLTHEALSSLVRRPGDRDASTQPRTIREAK